MGPTLLCELGLFLLCTLLCTGHAQDAVLTIEPNWSSFLIGEFVTFMCDMNEGAETDWEYKLNKDGREFVRYNKNKYYMLEITSTGYSGEYQCSGHWKSSRDTKNSNTVSIIVLGKPRATLTAGTTIIPVGGSVTLTCSMGSSAEWKYEWFRRTQNTNEVQIRRDDRPNRDIRVSQGGIYRCRGRRGNPVYYTDESDEVTIEITFSNKAAVKQQQHNWTQIFSGETITLTCEVQEEGEPTEWEYQWRGPRQTTQWTHNNYWRFRVSESSSGDYMCKSQRRDDSYSSTEWSEAFTLSVTTDQPKAQIGSDVRDSPVGGSVTLNCSVNRLSGWKYYWYRYDKSSEPLTTQDAFFSSDGQIRVSQEGLYRCRGGRGDPVYYTEYSDLLSIDKNTPGTESSSFLAPLIVGLVCGVLLIFLFLLLRHFKKSKDSHFIRTQSTNQSSATNHMINQDEAQHNQHTSPLQDDSVVYAQVSYNKAKAKRAKGKSAPAAAEETLYSEVKLHTALDDSLLYAQVSYNKAKANRDKGRSAPAAADETIYAEVKPQTAVGDCIEIIL